MNEEKLYFLDVLNEESPQEGFVFDDSDIEDNTESSILTQEYYEEHIEPHIDLYCMAFAFLLAMLIGVNAVSRFFG